jgi:hypothetical protein
MSNRQKVRARSWHMEEGGVFLFCDSLRVGAALELLAVTTRNSGVGLVLSDR